jgi:hypothetical protein
MSGIGEQQTATMNAESDLEILRQLSANYLASDQNGDVQCYDQMLAEDFTASLPIGQSVKRPGL